jgi:two-component system sensor histidine kinase TctE
MLSLRRHLLAWVLPPLVIVVTVAAGGAYLLLRDRLTASFDQDLTDIAAALLPHVVKHDGKLSLLLSSQSDKVLRSDSSDQVYYAVRTGKGDLIGGDRDLVAPDDASATGSYFWDAVIHGVRVRAALRHETVDGTPLLLIAAETTSKRDRAQWEALLGTVLPAALLSIAAAMMMLYGVRRGLTPLERLREEIQARSFQDLRPIGEEDVVQELKPVVRELNDMLGRLAQAQGTQVRFVANAAHQLRTPIAGLVAQLDLARDDPARGVHLAQARAGAARLARLAQQLLSLAAADPASNPKIEQLDCDLSEIVRGRADAWLRATLPRGVEVEFDLDSAPIHGNPVLVGELATNLVDNASRYGARNVRVATRRWGQASLLEVSDDGPGIPPAERGRIFERFYRLDNESTEGSGLGLAIVREIAQRHNASVELSERPDRSGTRVGVMFPAA